MSRTTGETGDEDVSGSFREGQGHTRNSARRSRPEMIMKGELQRSFRRSEDVICFDYLREIFVDLAKKFTRVRDPMDTVDMVRSPTREKS